MPLIRVTDLADPRRCQGAVKNGQCDHISEEDSRYCLVHGGVAQAPIDDFRLYALAQAKDRLKLSALSTHHKVKTLREEISLARLMVEKIWNSVASDDHLIRVSNDINRLLLTIDRLVKTTMSAEKEAGELLSRDAVHTLGESLVRIILDELSGLDDYERIADSISLKLVDAISVIGNDTPDI